MAASADIAIAEREDAGEDAGEERGDCDSGENPG